MGKRTPGIYYDEKRKHWQGKMTLPNGERRSVYGKKEREVREKLAQLRREVEAGMHGTTGGQQTFREFAAGWLAHHRSELAAKTVASYSSIFRNHFDGIGDLPLTKLTPAIVQAHYTKKLQVRASTTVHHIHAFFQVVLENAVRLGILPRNPTHSADAPPIKTKEFKPFSEEQVQVLVAALRGTVYEPVFVLALATGMREAELLGLTWADIDWARQLVRVDQTIQRVEGRFQVQKTKSRASRRKLPLTDYVAIKLAEQRERQAEQRELLGDAWGETWGLVFTTQAGKAINGGPLLKEFRRVLRTAGLPIETRIHDLRHTFATLLLERGVHIKVVSELLGHNSVEITLRIYGHVTPRMQGTAVAEINALLPATTVDSEEIDNGN